MDKVLERREEECVESVVSFFKVKERELETIIMKIKDKNNT